MADDARKKTDKLLEEMEKEVEQIYSRASKEISEKWEKYMDSHKEKVESAYGDLRQALASGDRDAIKEARANYERVVKNVTLNNDRYNAMVKETSAKLSHVNEVASDYVNGNMAKVYTLNYNEFANEDIDGYTFTLVNEQAVKNLATEDKSLLPAKKIDIPKDMAWNTKSINSEVLQGILQGENIPKIADRLAHVTDMNKNSSVRNARTMVTSAENKGRQDSFKKAESDGVIMKRRWVATNDDRTRAWHADLDGVEVDLDEPWENEYGEIMYPGDPSADPANVYNCRCSIRAIVAGFKWNQEEPEEEPEEIFEPVEFDGGNALEILDEGQIASMNEYAKRMDDENIEKFNKVLSQAKFNSGEGSYYDPVTNEITISKDESKGSCVFHESTHYYDFNQEYTITEDWKKVRWVEDENGDFNKEIYYEKVVISEKASFSEYIAHEWDYSEYNESSMKQLDQKNIVEKLGLSDTYGYGRDSANVENDVKAVRMYMDSKGISRTDPDYEHLSDFISAMTYDASLGSLVTGGHDYNYWVRGDDRRITEITAGYNVLKSIGREDLIDVERELAPNLMNLIEKEWKKIW